LGQDGHALALRVGEDWRDIPANPDAELCHLGEKLERLVCGQHVVMLHRVTNRLGAERLSFPLLIDPGTAAVVDALPIVERAHDVAAECGDHAKLPGFCATSGALSHRHGGPGVPRPRRASALSSYELLGQDSGVDHAA
jgi:hypothetical protein